MEFMLRNKKTILSFILPALIIYTIIVIVPIFSSVYYSFFRWNILDTIKFTGINNYISLFTKDDVFVISAKNTFLLMFWTIVIQTPLAIALAIAISGSIKGKRYFKTVYFLPNILSSVAIGLLWSFIYNPDFGIVNRLLTSVGLENLTRLWLADEKTVMGSVVVVVCWQFVGYHMIIYLAAIENIPSELKEAALIDGVNQGKMIRYITLPLIKPIIRIDTILMATGSLRFFDLIYVMTYGGPNHASEVIASYMYYKAFRTYQYGYGSAISVVLLLLCLIVTVILKKMFSSEEIQY
ncbi:binding-protein-dependent transport system inner membrane component [Thermoclostridium stercorarium subsp. stercorarium DSM 8532]|jgi:raffinose/stachyose/melibiose transport system permease protein|uniref:Binding-protein-dependent transport system inner membrane component n=3 Tax=Thermoclostridium stercorarium TaxID=1510 RepID=L7VQM6_THES1|nr:sugar ABC transporter permease [Thermoclostridium stercorarium]AGC68681.1 binding-protein-dependent transport system inner membrane component [Thermoclostridium stercorarium subsp. stercorarium DSM 8532]AGI39691.1 ABC transporter permease subunit [Thermoclostridium stercorarium subsp. stercorarium DSM 8532]ANX01545.1 ABC transporter permease [Thermoclostridium stercorarium subsp. leptospartum DSM 9219]UZQ84662.1 sugar ABC transporter permease [Thermoclostridium stercorarium]